MTVIHRKPACLCGNEPPHRLPMEHRAVPWSSAAGLPAPPAAACSGGSAAAGLHILPNHRLALSRLRKYPCGTGSMQRAGAPFAWLQPHDRHALCCPALPLCGTGLHRHRQTAADPSTADSGTGGRACVSTGIRHLAKLFSGDHTMQIKTPLSQPRSGVFSCRNPAFKFHDCVAWRSSDGSLHGSGQPDCDSTA